MVCLALYSLGHSLKGKIRADNVSIIILKSLKEENQANMNMVILFVHFILVLLIECTCSAFKEIYFLLV